MVSNPRTKLGSDQFCKICKVYNPSTELGSDEVRNMVPNPRIKFGSDDVCNMSNNPKTGLGSDDFCSVNVVSDPKTVLGSDEFCNVDVVSSPRIHSGQTNLLQTTVSNPENRIRATRPLLYGVQSENRARVSMRAPFPAHKEAPPSCSRALTRCGMCGSWRHMKRDHMITTV